MEVDVNIHTKRITPEMRVFVARPGAKYRFFERFIEANFVGPDLPGLDLPPFDDIAEVDDLEARVRRSVEYRRYFMQGDRDKDAPESELAEYERLSVDRATSQFLRLVRAYFHNIQAGDLVVVPSMNFKGMANIGEFVGAPNRVETLGTQIYGDMPLSGRRVKWLGAIERAKLPAQTLDALQKPTSLFLLPRAAWPTIFRRAYGSYLWDGEYGSRFEITADRYQTTDDFYIQAFFNFVAANTAAVAEGRGKVLSFKEGAFSAEGVAPDLYTNVNSPGGLSLKSLLSSPIVIAVMLQLAIVVGPQAYAAAMDGTITFGNSLAPVGDACVAEVSTQVITQLKLLGFDLWAEACQHVRAAAAATGVSSTVEVVTK